MAAKVNLVTLLREAELVTRREFLKRAAGTHLAATLFGALMAACQPAAPAAPSMYGKDSATHHRETMVAQQAFAVAHPWFRVEKLGARSHFLMFEVPEAMAAAVEEFVVA